MKQDRPSLTAQRVATMRAAHQVLDRPPVFEDPLAFTISGFRGPGDIRLRRRPNTSLSRYFRAFVAARSRISEDELAMAVKRGICQYVILGAGLDTFAYRNPHAASGLRVFEVDHPATQEWKRRQLERTESSNGAVRREPRYSRKPDFPWQ